MKWIAIFLVVLLPLIGCSSAQRPVIVDDDHENAMHVSSVLVDDWVRIHLKDGLSYQGRVTAMDAEGITVLYTETGNRRRFTSPRFLAWTDIESMEVKDPPGGIAKTAEFLLGISIGVVSSLMLILSQISMDMG